MTDRNYVHIERLFYGKTIEVLQFLRTVNGYTNKNYQNYMRKEIGTSCAQMSHIISKLERIGLVYGKRAGRRKYFFLTEKGVEVADHLIAASELIKPE